MMRKGYGSAVAIMMTVFLGCDSGGGAGEPDAGSNGNNNNGAPVCGDGIWEVPEECDDGAANSDSAPDACRTDCRLARCGDGAVDSGEECDDGIANSDTEPDACRLFCDLAACGDNVIDPLIGENCDDGNTTPGDGCSPSCVVEGCGNGELEAGEICDDGNNLDGDGCSADCLSDESCGNGLADPGEICDDGNNLDADGCAANCLSDETCGNGVTDGAVGEECDDGNTTSGDGCSGTGCLAETCTPDVADHQCGLILGGGAMIGNNVDGYGGSCVDAGPLPDLIWSFTPANSGTAEVWPEVVGGGTLVAAFVLEDACRPDACIAQGTSVDFFQFPVVGGVTYFVALENVGGGTPPLQNWLICP